MMNATERPLRVRPGVGPSISIVDTTELRWFVAGPLPDEIRTWFIGSTGIVEERRDTYLVHDRTCADHIVSQRAEPGSTPERGSS